MSFRLFIYYCAMCGGWAAVGGWLLGAALAPAAPPGSDGIKGMFLGLTIALALSLVDTLWNLSLHQFGEVSMRVGVAVLVGCVGGVLGGFLGSVLYNQTKLSLFYVFGWTLTGALIGTSIAVFELLSGIVRQQDVGGAQRKLLKALIGGLLGGLLGGVLSLLLRALGGAIFSARNQDDLASPTAWGFVALGACIGLLIGLAQVLLKEAWIRVESGRRAGRELILTRECTTIGRAEACEIGLFGDNAIERQHAYILQVGNRYYVEDAGTPAGTYLNDQRIHGRMLLQTGDLIRVGSTVLCFRERQKRAQAALV
jgi:hypothetical protein